MKGILYKLRIQKSLSAKITWMNVSIILLIFITLIIATVSINYQLTLGNEKQKMNVYIPNTLSSIDNKLKDMGLDLSKVDTKQVGNFITRFFDRIMSLVNQFIG